MPSTTLNDKNLSYDAAWQHFYDADRWAQDHCSSYRGYSVQDVSDFSMLHDQIAVYEFAEEKDLLWFSLRWGQ
jgi:hypothetical protein